MYINKHYQETQETDKNGNVVKDGDILNVNDVLETLETQMETYAKGYLDKYKSIDKFSAYFKAQKKAEAKAAAEAEVEEEPEEVEVPEVEEEEEEENADFSPKNNTFGQTNQKVPFALLSQADKVKFLAAARKRGDI